MSIPPPGNTPPVAPACPRCGAPNEGGLTQCARCGQSLVASWPPPPGGYPPPQGFVGPQAYPPQATGSGFGGLIPTGNPSALTAYYLGIFSVIPCLAIPMGIAALVLGLKGLRLVKERPEVRGRTHAWVGIIAGGLFALINIGAVLFVAAEAGIQR